MEMSLGLSLAVCIYNSGLKYTLTKLFEKASVSNDATLIHQWRQIDKEQNVSYTSCYLILYLLR